MNVQQLKKEWFANPRADILSGITVALALIPEAIAFSIIAGVDPMVGLYASFCIALVISFAGGRPAMISAATGAMALLMTPLVKEHGIEYLFATTILTGILQILMGVLRIGKLITFVPHSVMLGFVNALAILIFMAQLPQFTDATWVMYAIVAGTLAIIYVLPRITRAVPSALVAIIVMTIVSIACGLDVRTVGDMGEITRSLPSFHLAAVPFTFDTLLIIFPYAFAMALVGILESLLTATIVDEMTDTRSSKNREVKGQGIANIVTGLFGGMAGCAMIGQSVINVKSGGRGRLSTFVAGLFLLFLILILGDVVKQIPMGALVGVMFMVSIGTFNWRSFTDVRKVPVGDTVIMLVTVAIVVATNNLALGVITGVIISSVRFGWRMARLHTTAVPGESGEKIYVVSGQLFFGTMAHFTEQFDYQHDPAEIVIDLSRSHVWDQSAAAALAKVSEKYRQLGKTVRLHGLNEESRTLIERIGLAIPVRR